LPDPAQDALRAMRAQLDEAHAAADRLVQEAAGRAAEAGPGDPPQVPPRGWQSDPPRDTATSDLRALLGLLASVRDTVPAELSRQLAGALRDLLLALRALIDWYLERLGEPAARNPGVEVEDIPLD
jgi:hypothetical protein